MATSNAHRVAAFLLAGLFLLTSVGGTAYVIWQINQQEGGIVKDDSITKDDTDGEEACGQKTYSAVSPMAVPAITKIAGAITELKITDVKEGTGATVEAGDCVAALYYGTLAKDGTKFDGNYETGKPIEFSLDGVIPGWTEGIPGMKVGGVRRLEIPSAKGYGEKGSGEVIPPNSDLVFEVEIINTRKTQ